MSRDDRLGPRRDVPLDVAGSMPNESSISANTGKAPARTMTS
jgi:hypothetical protein